MAATVLPVQTLTAPGVTPQAQVAADPVNGNVLATNNGVSTWIEATNTDAADQTLTITTPVTVAGLDVADQVITLAAGAAWRSGPLAVTLYGDQPLVTASAATVTLAAYQI